jgi:hypothetical protein
MKIPSAKGNPEQLQSYKEVFSLIPGVEDIELNPVTGSIVLKYDPDRHHEFGAGFTDHVNRHHAEPPKPHAESHRPRPPTNEIDAVAGMIEEEAQFLAEHSQTARVIVDLCRGADRHIKVATHNVLDLKMLLAVGVVGAVVFEIGASAATPVWVTLALFGLNHFIEMQEQAREQREEREERTRDEAQVAATAAMAPAAT